MTTPLEKWESVGTQRQKV